MTIPLVILSLVLLLVVYGLVQAARRRVRKHGAIVLVWRFLTGTPLDGKPRTDAGFVRPGSRALTRTGHASRFHHRPRWQRAAWRTGPVLGVLASLYGLLVAHTTTVRCLFGVTLIGFAYAILRAVLAIRRYRHHRRWVRPVHTAIAPLAGVPVVNRPRAWITVSRDRSRAVVQLPQGWHADDRTRQAIATAAAEKLAIEQPDISWRLGGPTPRLTITAGSSPPARVTFGELRTVIEAASSDELVLGVGKRGRTVSVSLSGDSPHIGLSMASGAGKSVVARLVGSQICHRGGLLVVLDIKRISHSWARGLPNAFVAKSPQEIHQALLLLRREVQRRNELADDAVDVEGNVHTSFPRLFVVAEELNATISQLKAYWRTVKEPGDPARSPAIDAMAEMLFVGRQVKTNLLLVAQRMSAEAAGGGDARENLACRILGRYSQSNWKMMCPEFAMPPSSRRPGHVQIVTDVVRETQIGFMTGREAADYASSGVIGTLPHRFGGPRLTPATGTTELEDSGSDLRVVTDTPPELLRGGSEPVTLSEAVSMGLVDKSLPALRMARHRDPRFPQPVTQRGIAHVYDPDALARWAAGIS